VLAHAGLLASHRLTRRIWPEGAVVVVVTYVLGMGLRVLSGRGIAPAFLVVAAVFLTLTMLGWRAVARFARPGPPSAAAGAPRPYRRRG
jgi:hypothetical protein